MLAILTGCGNGEYGNGSATLNTIKPIIITLNGASTIELIQGIVYTELEATATDDRDGTVAVTVSGSVDAMLALRNSLGLNMSGTSWQASATIGDVDCNGSSNSTDAMLLLRYSLGLSMDGTGWCVN